MSAPDGGLNGLLQPFREMAMFEDCELTSPESPGIWGDTPIHVAAYDNNVGLLMAFMPFVRDIDVEGELRFTPLHSAILNGSLDSAGYLISLGADLELRNDMDDSALTMMARRPAFFAVAEKYGFSMPAQDDGGVG